MMRVLVLVILSLLILTTHGYGQVNFKKDWINDDPVKRGSAISISDKIKIHQDYLAKAIKAGDTTRQFYGILYLQADHYDDINYEESTNYLMQAENIANESGFKNWQGVVKRKFGWLTFAIHGDMRGAIEEYEAGARLCLEAKDSFCYSECMEHIAAMYSHLKQFEISRKYFDIAIPILKNYDKGSLASGYNNLSGLYGNQNLQHEAIRFLDSAIKYNKETGNLRQELVFRCNRGLALIELNLPDSAIRGFEKSMVINKKNEWLENLAYDYDGMALAYEKKGDFRTAYQYRIKHHRLTDSLFSGMMKAKVARLMTKNELQKKELALQKSQIELAVAKRTSEKRAWIIVLSLAVLTFVLWIWWSENKKAKKERIQSKQTLTELTRILLDKNSLLVEMEQKIEGLQDKNHQEFSVESANNEESRHLIGDVQIPRKQPFYSGGPKGTDFEMNLYNQKILTSEDWSAFKIYFEKVFPDYIRRLRTSFPSITEAEERLFLFIKLNLTNKEAAAILGISVESVKKTRSRLRKRLALDENTDIDDFVRQF